VKPKTEPTVKIAPCVVTYKKGKKHIEIEIVNHTLDDWIDKQILQTKLHISNRTLQTLRSKKQIPFSRIGRKILYYQPGILTLLEENMFC
jgi:hypothetical protein